MSWASRFGDLAGKFSPFGRNTNPSNTQVKDSDFSYITTDDLVAHNVENGDTLYIKSRKVSHPLHFPAGAIDSGEITVGVLRIAVARKLDIKDARRIKLFYKGRNMKEDKALARDEGLRSGTGAEILCVVGESSGNDSYGPGSEGTPFSGSDDEEESGDDSSAPTSAAGGASKKKKKRRGGGKNKRRGPQSPQPTNTPPPHSSANLLGSEYLPIPSNGAPRPSSVPPKSPSAAPSRPASPMGQLAQLSGHFEQNLKPLVEAFLKDPPGDKAKRDFEHKKLSETIMGQVLLKLDGVETDGKEEVRARRKALVKEVQGWLTTLDNFSGQKS